MFQKSFARFSFLAFALLCSASLTQAALFNATTNYSVGNSPRGIWLGNLRGTGVSRDMAVANFNDNTVSVRLCLDDGTFGHEDVYAVGLNPTAVRTGDFNKDGFEDIVVVNSGTNTVSILRNLGGGANFAVATSFVVGTNSNPNPSALAVADVNGDGKLDLIVANHDENSVSILFGLGGGLFGDATNNYSVGTGPSSVYVGDMNHDGFADIVTADTTDGTVTILHGAANGVFGTPTTIAVDPFGDPQPVCALVADLNNDGFMDIAVADQASGDVTIILQDTLGNFDITVVFGVGASPKSLLLRDLNRDGIVDIAVANSGDDNVQIFLGQGDGLFSNEGTFSVGDNPSVIVGSNFNGDNATDMAVANSDGASVTILLFAAPLADNVNMSVNEDTPASVILRGRILDNSPLMHILTDCPTHGTLNIDCPTNGYLTNLVYTPDTNFFGTDTFYYQVTDGSTTSTVATVAITIVAVNDAPSFDLSAASVTVYEDAATTNISGFATNISPGPANEVSQSVFFICTTTNNSFFGMRPIISPSGALSFRAALNRTGTNIVSVFLKDNGGTLRGGLNNSATQTFAVVVLPNPVKPLAGTYSGLYYDLNGVAQESSGFLKFTLRSNRAYSGKVICDGGNYSFSGLFDYEGHSQTTVPRNTTTLTINFTLDLTNGTDQVTADITDGIWTATYTGDRALYHSVTNPAPQAGKYTMTIPDNIDNAVLYPAGDSYATLSVSSSGVVTATGKTADGAAFSQSANLSKNGQWPFYSRLYNSRGSLWSQINFTNRVESSFEGNISWIKLTNSTAFYPDGFTNILAVFGSTYTPPPLNTTVLAFTNCYMFLRDGNLPPSLDYTGILNLDNKVYVNGYPVLKLTSSSGLMNGTLYDSTLRVGRALRGVVFQQQNIFRGYLRGTNQTGSVLLQAAP